jgi:predicted Zn-dependent protease
LKYLITTILLLIALSFLGQENNVQYQPIPSFFFSELESDSIYNRLKKTEYKHDLKAWFEIKKYKELLENRAKYFKYLNEERLLMFNDKLTNQIQSLVDFILKKNPSIKDKITVLLKRDNSVNASCLGQGFILVNIGLLERVETTDQLLYILCHEIAHNVDLHYAKSLLLSYKQSINKDLIKEARKANKKKYGAYYETEKIFYSATSKNMGYSRHYEHIADSLGLVFYNKTGMRSGTY